MKRILFLLVVILASCGDDLSTNKLTTCEYYQDSGSQMVLVGVFTGNYNLEFEDEHLLTDLSKSDYPLSEADQSNLEIETNENSTVIHTTIKDKRSVLILR